MREKLSVFDREKARDKLAELLVKKMGKLPDAAELWPRFYNRATPEPDRRRGCGWRLYQCQTCPHNHAVPGTCGSRLCPVCAHVRASRVAARYSASIEKIKRKQHVVLTIGAVPFGELLAGIRAAVAAFRRLRHGSQYVRERVAGGIYSVHLKPTRDGAAWNVHIHCIVYGRGMENTGPRGSPDHRLSDEWRKALGYGPPRQVFVRRLDREASGLVELVYGYDVTQLPRQVEQLPADACRELVHVLERTGIRLGSAFGNLYGCRGELDQAKCPACGESMECVGGVSWKAKAAMIGAAGDGWYHIRWTGPDPPVFVVASKVWSWRLDHVETNPVDRMRGAWVPLRSEGDNVQPEESCSRAS